MASAPPLDTVPAVHRHVPVLVLVAALAVTGCSDDSDGAGGGDVTTTTEASGVIADVALDADVHAGGFRLSVEEARVVQDAVGRSFVEVEATITNEGPDPVPFTVPARLEGAGPAVDRIEPEEPPRFRPGAARQEALRFPVPDQVGESGEGLEAAWLALGDRGRHQTVVPFDGSEPRTLAPGPVVVGEALVAGNVTFTVHGGQVRFDDPLAHENLTEGRALLVLSFDAERGVQGGPNLTAENFRLRLPDATVVAVRRDGRSAPNLLLEPGREVIGLTVRFEIPAGSAGDHALVVVGPYGDDGSEVRAELPFLVAPHVYTSL